MNVVLAAVPFALAWYGYYAERTAEPYFAKGNYLIIVLFAIGYTVYGNVYDAFLVSMIRIPEMVYSQGLAAFVADGLMYIVTWLLTKHLPCVLLFLIVFAAQVALSVIWSWAAHWWYFKNFPPKRTVVVYGNRLGMEELVAEYGMDRKFEVKNVISAEACISNMEKELADMDVVFFFDVRSHDRNIILKYCVKQGLDSYVIPRIGDVLMSSARQIHMFHLPILKVERYHPPMEYVAAKRLMDILLCGAALILLLPVFVITAAAIYVSDKGPVFYRQCRLTQNGKRFYVLKFRSMRVDAEKDGVARLSTGENDIRVTSVGRIIRKTRIDELPQLLNILRGDMSLVGPRPERPELAAQYEKELPEFALRLQAKAGLTGYAQVYGKYNTTPYDKLQMDLMYIAKPSLLEDLRIMFATVKILFLPESTEGVKEGQTTAVKETDARQPDKELVGLSGEKESY